MSMGIMAERFLSAGYLARNCSKRASSSGEKVMSAWDLPVRVSQHEIHTSEPRDHVCDQRPFDHFGNSLQVAEARAAPVDAIGLLGAVTYHVASHLAARRLHRLVDLAFRHAETL